MFPTFYSKSQTMFYVSDENETPGDRLRKIREGLKLSARKAEQLSDPRVSHSNIGKIETGITAWENVQRNTIKGLARAYGRTPEQLLNEVNGTPYPKKPNIFTDQVTLVNPDMRLGSRMIPEYNMVGVGPGGQDGDILGYIDIPDSWSGEHVGYRAVGDSMSPKIEDGDTVVVRVQSYASPKNIIVCWLPGEGMICKYLQERTDEGVHMLTSYNAAHPPIWTKDLTIYGVVREIRQRVEIINGNH